MRYRPLKVEDIEKRIVPILKKYNIPKAAVFGSSARNEMRRGSDVDIIVDADNLMSGLVFIEVKRKLENTLGRKVDLISYHSLQYSNNKDEILAGAKVIYEKR